jgi:hypothetical protein
VLGFDNAKARNIVTSIPLLNDTRDFFRPLFGVVILHQGTRIEKRAGHLTLITLSNHDLRHRTWYLRQGLAYLLQTWGIVGLLGTPLRELWIEQVFLAFAIVSNSDRHALRLLQVEGLQRTQDAMFINGLNLFAQLRLPASPMIA